MHRVSVVIPVYNGENYLAKTIESVLSQTVKTWEIILVNDGSTDKTEEIILSYMEHWKNIVYVNNQYNMGIGWARQKGIETAKGDYVCFLSADDEYCKEYIETMLNFADRKSILYSDFYIVYENGEENGVAKSPDMGRDEFVKRVIETAKEDKMFVCWNIFSPRDVQLKVSYDKSLRFGEDLDFLLRSVLVHNINYIHVPFPLFKYRIHNNMVTHKKWEKIHENNKKIFDKINKLVGGNIL